MNHAAYTWEIAEPDRAAVADLAEALGVSRLIALLLVNRGIASPAEGRAYLEPSASRLRDPFELLDMQAAVDRITQAKANEERVLVFGDYDVDGISGTALLTDALKRFGIAWCGFGMPDRQMEGYGLNPERVEAAAQDGVTLIITVDNGIAAHEAARRAKDLGVDLIITDHHQISGPLPEAVAIINPQRQENGFPGKDLCGAGVAFKLAWALLGEQRDADLAALGAVADVVPLRGENRDLVALGLRHAGAVERPGMREIAKLAGFELHGLRAEHVGFQIGPRINAGGRMGDGLAGLHLLMAERYDDAAEYAQALNEANEQRKAVESDIFEKCMRVLEQRFDPEQRSIVLASDKWHPGVIGIVASRIQSRYYRPVVLVAFDEHGEGRGSGRSVPGFNIADGLAACGAHLVQHGGHAMAAGLAIRREMYDAFKEAFEAQARAVLGAAVPARALRIDAQVSLGELDSQLVRSLECLEPIGHANPAAVFCTFQAEVARGSIRRLNGGHLKLGLREGTGAVDAIGFRMGHLFDDLQSANTVDVAFTPNLNTWNGETRVQLVLKDIRPA